VELTIRNVSIIALFLYFAVLLIFSYTKEKNHNIIDYFFAGRSLPFWALSITFIASWWGAGSALSTADLAFNDGLGAFWYYGVPVLVSTLILIICSKMIRRIGYLTQSQMMEARYSKNTAKMLAVTIMLFMTVSAASQMVGIGLFFKGYLDIDYTVGVLIGTSVVLIYSVLGGFRGVVATDIIQFILLTISAAVIFAVAMINSGGWENIMNIAAESGKEGFGNFFTHAEKYLPYVISFGCAWAIQANVWQRISATRNSKDAEKMSVMSFVVYIPLYLIVVLTGMAGIALYSDLPAGGIVSAIVSDYMPPILGAFVFIGISAAIMSTMDSLINTGSMTLVMDIYK
jgi:SSS family solute:Na+ symporter